jgi:LysM repeat protein
MQIDFSGQSIDNFHVEKKLVSYPACSLYLARDTGADEPVYLQIMNLPPESDGELDGRFRQQMRTLSQLKHPIIAPVQHIGRTSDNHSYAVIQHISGVSLAQKLSEWQGTDRQLRPAEAITLIRHLADALALVHPSGIIHHDLRPENILIQDDNTPVLIDLGIPYVAQKAKPIDLHEVTTLDYASPEQLNGETISGRSNIYSLGVILYELLAGHPPQIPVSSWDIFERTTLPKEISLEQAKPGLVKEVYDVVNTCLWRQEWSRFDTTYALIKGLDAALQAEEVRAQHVREPGRFPRWLYVVIPAVLLIAALVLFLLLRQGPEPTEMIEATAAPSATLEQTATQAATATLPPSSPTNAPHTEQLAILLLAPTPGAVFEQGDRLFFDWYWPTTLEPEQQFSVQLVVDDGVQSIGITADPVTDTQYRIAVDLDNLELEPGTYDWFVALETVDTAENVLNSERQSFIVQAPPVTETTTPSPTTITLTETVSPTPVTSCIPSRPDGWVSYVVQPGDYLYNLALETGTTVARIQEVNCLEEPIIGTGITLWLPSLPATDTPTPSPTVVEPTSPPPSRPEPKNTPSPPPLPTPS